MTQTAIEQVLDEHYGSYFSGFRRLSAAKVEGMIVSGSGLNAVLEKYTALEVIHASDIEGFPQPSVAGHSTAIRIIEIEGKRLAHFTGRCHLYEGFSLQDALAQVGLAAKLGAKFALLTNSAGGLNPHFRAGDIMLASDILNLMFRPVKRGWMQGFKPSPLATAAQSQILSSEWRTKISTELTRNAVPHKEGVYAAVTGPTYETPAEARMYRALGSHAIGMSTVHEAEFARACGMTVAVCSLITNTLPEAVPVTVSHDEVVEAAHIGASKVAQFVQSACTTVVDFL